MRDETEKMKPQQKDYDIKKTQFKKCVIFKLKKE